jgi:DNA-binding MarR family transcriptional regulator
MEASLSSVEATVNAVDPTTSHDRSERIQAEWQRERPDLDVSTQSLIGRLHRLALALTAELTPVFDQHGLGEGDFDVLAALRRAGDPYERTPTELARTTMITSGATTKRIDRLEAAGLVVRRRRDDDGRGRVVALTAEGLERIDAAFTDHIANEHRLVADLSSDEREHLAALLRTWLRQVDPTEFE